MNDNTLKSFWPVEFARERDLYFYLEAIEAYLPHSRVRVKGHGEMILLGGYSYLGLNGHPRINQAAQEAIERYGTGTHGVRLLAGTLVLHQELEARIAAFKGAEAAAIFSSGYLANVSTIAALVSRDDAVICDKEDHASIVDGCALSRARFLRFRHNDTEHLETLLKQSSDRRRRLVIVDAVFSMSGHIVNLPEVSRLCHDFGAWLMVDEAHSLGVLGRTGHGIEEHFGLSTASVDIKMGTFSKAIPSMGGYVAGSARLCEFLQHNARGFIYSGALAPASAAGALAALDVIDDEPERVRRLHENSRHFGARLRDAGLWVPNLNGESPIFPILCGDDEKAWKAARHCQRRGVYVQGIPYPVVPRGGARLRAAVSSTHRHVDLDYCVSVLHEAVRCVAGTSNDDGGA